MAHPKADPSWATDATFNAPGKTWDTDPTKVAPPAGKAAQGWAPDDEPPAEFLNDWQNKAGLLLDYLRRRELQNWTLSPAVSAAALNALGYDPSTGTLVASGVGADIRTMRSLDGGVTWAAPTTAPTASTVVDVASDGAGNWIMVTGSQTYFESADDGVNWTARTYGAAGDLASAITYDANSALWVLSGGGSSGAFVYTSPDRVAWTQRFLSVSFSSIDRVWPNVAGALVGLTDLSSIITSSDALTWTARLIEANAAVKDVVYSEGAATWMIVGTQLSGTVSAIWTSTDGTAFALPSGLTGLPTTLGGFLSSDQGELFVLHGALGAVYSSTDRGATWRQETAIASGFPRGPVDKAATDSPTSLRFLGNRFAFATAGGNVWQSAAAL